MTPPLATRARRHLAAVRADGERGSLVLAMLVVLVATSVAALILPLLLTSAQATKFDDTRARQLAAAQSGLEATIARIRATAATTTAGPVPLPCDVVTGTVLGATSLRYKAQIRYYATDPSTLSATQLVDRALVCLSGRGLAAVPGYARITSWGTTTPGTSWTGVAQRNVSATYVVKSTNANIVGGLVHVAQYNGSRDLCLDAGKAPFTSGITMQPCTPGNPGQIFAYQPSLTLTLVASVTATDPLGLCVDGGARPQATGVPIALRACARIAVAQQQWSNNDFANFVGTDDGSTLNARCLTVNQPNVAGSVVTVEDSCGKPANYYDNRRNWLPDPAVGAGAAGAATSQLVNYGQFGRCLDVPGYNRDADHLIAWPCKQAPNPANVLWNQKWQLPATAAGTGTGLITTTPTGAGAYCLRSNHDDTTKSVRIIVCPAGAATDANYRWTVRTAVASYAASYQIEDAWGNCLQPEPLTAAQLGAGASTIVLATCSASTLQKWNAPANVDAPSVKDQIEN